MASTPSQTSAPSERRNDRQQQQMNRDLPSGPPTLSKAWKPRGQSMSPRLHPKNLPGLNDDDDDDEDDLGRDVKGRSHLRSSTAGPAIGGPRSGSGSGSRSPRKSSPSNLGKRAHSTSPRPQPTSTSTTDSKGKIVKPSSANSTPTLSAASLSPPLPQVSPSPSSTALQPQGWWHKRDAARPWVETQAIIKETVGFGGSSGLGSAQMQISRKRRRTIPPEQEDRWDHTRVLVIRAARSALGNALDVSHEVLEIGAEVLQFAPVAGLGEAARVLLGIWDAVQLVETNRLACLFLTERCANHLLAIREEIFAAGDQVGQELAIPLGKLEEAFKKVLKLLQRLVQRPFLKRYLRRDEILRQIAACDSELNDAVQQFSISIQIRILKQLQYAEAKRAAETSQLAESIHRIAEELEATPKRRVVDLPLDSQEQGPLTTSPAPTYRTLPEISTADFNVFQQMPVAHPASHLNDAIDDTGKGPRTPTTPTTSTDILSLYNHLCTYRSSLDHDHDLADLRRLMREALATSNDADMVRVLQVRKEEMPEAIKTLQRTLEEVSVAWQDEGRGGITEAGVREDGDDDANPGELGPLGLTDNEEQMFSASLEGFQHTPHGHRLPTVNLPSPLERSFSVPIPIHASATTGEIVAGTGSSAPDSIPMGSIPESDSLGLTGTTRSTGSRFSTASNAPLRRQTTWGSRQSHVTASASDSSADRQTQATGATGQTDGTGSSSRMTDWDTLDKEFIEGGIDALRRISVGNDITLPSWTITKYEVDLDEEIGIGFFSHVYKGTWRAHTVGVKVLDTSTPQKLFLHEMAVWKRLRHPNVLPLLGASSASGDPPWFFVSPYMRHGNLVTYLKRLEPGDIWQPARMVLEVAKGMEYLHDNGVLHGDLKGTNVLMDDERHCVLADFGLSEMKSEVYRLSGVPRPQGALRWRAPELIDGSTGGSPSQPADVYAFGVLCVEILTKGAIPWNMTDDETVRRLVLQDNRRPPIPLTAGTIGLRAIIEASWARNPDSRPEFSWIVEQIRRTSGKLKDSPIPEKFRKFWEEDEMPGSRRESPDIRPPPLPIVGHGEDASAAGQASSSLSTENSYLTAEGGSAFIPVQEVITPLPEKTGDNIQTDTDAVMPYVPVNVGLNPDQEDQGLHIQMPEPIPFQHNQHSQHASPNSAGVYFPHGVEFTTVPPSGRTSPTSVSESAIGDEGIDVTEGLTRFESPLPTDELARQRRNERRYRLNIQHAYPSSLTLALWEPTFVELGAVGYLSKPDGQFITLLNAFHERPNVYGYGRVSKASQSYNKRNMAQRGLDAVQGFLTFRNRSDNETHHHVSRRYSFPLHAGQKSAYLATESVVYNYVDSAKAAKLWFQENIDKILQNFGKEHRIQKEDIFFVIGTLDASNYGLFVGHNNPEGQVHFNVFTSPRAGEEWGVFSTDEEPSKGGPSHHEDIPERHSWASKVSRISSSHERKTVLIARLRFKPDCVTPTSK